MSNKATKISLVSLVFFLGFLCNKCFVEIHCIKVKERKEKHTHKMIVEKEKLLQILKPASVFFVVHVLFQHLHPIYLLRFFFVVCWLL